MIRHLGSLPDRRHLRLRRAHHRPARARHPADERPAAAAARQGQHRARRRAQARGDRDRRPRRRPRARGRHRTAARSSSRARSRSSGASDTLTGRHLDDRRRSRTTVRTPKGALEVRGANAAQPAGRVDVDIPLGVLVVRHRRGRVGQELAHPRLVSRPRRVGRVDRPGARSAARGAATRRPTPACSTRSGRRSRRPTGSSRRCSAPTRRAPARPATAPASSTPTSASWRASQPTCEDCEGKRFEARVLEYQLGGQDISEVLAMSVEEAQAFFGAARRRRRPRTPSSTASPTSGSATSRSASR